MEHQITGKEKAEILKRYMIEFFPYKELLEIGFFTKEMKGDYESQAKRVCDFFGYNTVYDYGASEISCHITFAGERPKDEGFVTNVENIYKN